ncbi:hypothetical protein CERZMDRAFT_80926 [Cercospora zeae-maydis SCOH1-5]|uniref:Uncharacterized protein n=1 Tax=Cercospora zeae-maydis SCOH1-5 TaxID=717836 RepID=A0A6A6FTV5_9PEZI|nr:hypothetical protein CERZMDRAFT_80926 [Cercospora zeae-maydis SCOH1-5]
MAPCPVQRGRTLSAKISSPSRMLHRLTSFFCASTDEKTNEYSTAACLFKAADYEDVDAVPAPLHIEERTSSADMSCTSAKEANDGDSSISVEDATQETKLSATQKKNRNRRLNKKKKKPKTAATAPADTSANPPPCQELQKRTQASKPLFAELAANFSKYEAYMKDPEKREFFFRSITALTDTAAEALEARQQEGDSPSPKSADELAFEENLNTLCREGKQMLQHKDTIDEMWENAEEMGVQQEEPEELAKEIDLTSVDEEMLKKQHVLRNGKWILRVPDEEDIDEARRMYDRMLAGEWQEFLQVPAPPQPAATAVIDSAEAIYAFRGEPPSQIPAPTFPLRHSFTREGLEWQERPGQVLRRMSKSDSLRELAAAQADGAGEAASEDCASDQGYGSSSDRPETPKGFMTGEKRHTIASPQPMFMELESFEELDNNEMRQMLEGVFPLLSPYESALDSHREWLDRFRLGQGTSTSPSPDSLTSPAKSNTDEDASATFRSRTRPLLSKCRTSDESHAVGRANAEREWRRTVSRLSSPEYTHPFADRSMKVLELAKEDRVVKMEEEGLEKLRERMARMGELKRDLMGKA